MQYAQRYGYFAGSTQGSATVIEYTATVREDRLPENPAVYVKVREDYFAGAVEENMRA